MKYLVLLGALALVAIASLLLLMAIIHETGEYETKHRCSRPRALFFGTIYGFLLFGRLFIEYILGLPLTRR